MTSTADAIDTIVKKHERSIAFLKDQNDLFERGLMDIGDISSSGHFTSAKDASVAHNNQVISQLQKIVDAGKASGGDRDKFIDLLVS